MTPMCNHQELSTMEWTAAWTTDIDIIILWKSINSTCNQCTPAIAHEYPPIAHAINAFQQWKQTSTMQTWKNELGHVCFSSRHKHTGECQNPNGKQNTARPDTSADSHKFSGLSNTTTYRTHTDILLKLWLWPTLMIIQLIIQPIHKQNMNYKQSTNKTWTTGNQQTKQTNKQQMTLHVCHYACPEPVLKHANLKCSQASSMPSLLLIQVPGTIQHAYKCW